VFHNLEKQIHAAFRDRLRAQFGVESDFALDLAKSLKQPPKKIAADLATAVGRFLVSPRRKSLATGIPTFASTA